MSLSQEFSNSTHLPEGPGNSTGDVVGGNISISDGSNSTNSSSASGSSSGNHSLVSLFHCIVRISLLSSFICVSLLGNALLLLVFHRKPQLLQVANRFILNLLFADLLQAAVVMPLVVASSLPSFWPLSENVCTAIVTLMHLFAYVSINTIIVVSIDRYLSIIYPLSYPNKMTTTWSAMLILGTWVFSVVQSVPPALGWGDITFDRPSSLCVLQWNSSPTYTALNVLLSFLCPVAIIGVCYGMVFRAARRQNALVHPLRPRVREPIELRVAVREEAVIEGEAEVGGRGNAVVRVAAHAGRAGGRSHVRGKARSLCTFRSFPRRFPVRSKHYHSKAARVIFVIISSFILCMGPYSTLAIVSSAIGTASPWVNSCIFLLFFLQCCLHPYTYGYMHKSIKKEFTLLLLGIFCRGPFRQRNPSMENNFAMTESRTFHSHGSLPSAWKC